MARAATTLDPTGGTSLTRHRPDVLAVVSRALVPLAILLLLASSAASGSDEQAAGNAKPDVVSEEVRLGKHEQDRYFRISRPNAKAPRKGFAVLVILPGGDGGPDFRPFCENIFRQHCGPDWVAAQVVSVKWTDGQQVVWPTEKLPVEGMERTTEERVDAVVRDLAKWKRVDPKRVFVLAWSSSGPAAYAMAATRGSKPSGYVIAMSVFRPEWHGDLDRTRGKSFYLIQSREDSVTPFDHAERAAESLRKTRARVELVEYEGGHGWRGTSFVSIGRGLRWLEERR